MKKNDFLSILVEDGRKLIKATPESVDHEVMTECELDELAGHLLAEDIDTDAQEFFVGYMYGQMTKRLLPKLATYCIENSLYNASFVLDELRSYVREYYEMTGSLQGVLTNHRKKLWEQHAQASDRARQQIREEEAEERNHV